MSPLDPLKQALRARAPSLSVLAAPSQFFRPPAPSVGFPEFECRGVGASWTREFSARKIPIARALSLFSHRSRSIGNSTRGQSLTGCLRPGPLFSTVGQGPDALGLGVGSGRVGSGACATPASGSSPRPWCSMAVCTCRPQAPRARRPLAWWRSAVLHWRLFCHACHVRGNCTASLAMLRGHG